MGYSVRKFSDRHTFEIESASYAGRPLDRTVMFITKKVEYLLENLRHSKECLVFIEDSIQIPPSYEERNVFVRSSVPQKEYAQFVQRLADRQAREERQKSYSLTSGGYYLGENVSIGKNPLIEPECVIGHGVVIGDNAVIRSGAKIYHAVIGNGFFAGENCCVGTYGFTMADNDMGDKIRIPTLGNTRIGENVEVGALTNISRGSAGSTVLEDNVKLDSLVHIGHDAHLHRNVEITAGVVVGGFDELCEGVYIGINSTIRNRIQLGPRTTVGMGAVVTKSYPEGGVTLAGNPARPLKQKSASQE